MRLKDFQKILKKKKVPAALFINSGDKTSSDFVYFTGFQGAGILLVTSKKAVMLVHDMEYLSAKRTSRVPIKKTFDFFTDLKKLLKVKTAGLMMEDTSVASLKRLKKKLGVKFVDISDEVRSLRITKTPEELRLLRKACKLTDDIFSKTFLNFRKFRTESDVAAFMVGEATRLGLELAFPIIVASGPNSALPHHVTSTSRLKNGFCVIDFGVIFKGLCSDMTRTIYLGTPSQEDIDLYHRVYYAQQKAISICSAGKPFFDVDQYAKKMLGPYAKKMNHSIGHGLGFDCHEFPSPRKKGPFKTLEPNSVITIEPGVYIPKRGGIRIEDDIHITDKGPKVLTKIGKHLLIIKTKKNKR